MKCLDCGSTKIKSRSNYSHGKGSKSTTSLRCKICGSTNIEKLQVKKRYKR